jgi:hypothetical protein
MLSVQKCPTDKTGLGYVASTSDILFTLKTVFVKRTVPEPPSACVDKGNAFIGENPAAIELNKKPHTQRSPPICHHCDISGHIRSKCSQRQSQKLKDKRELPKKATSDT